MPGQRILVTGATGFIGRALVPMLVQQGAAVTMLLRERYAQPDLYPLPPSLTAVRAQTEVVYADLRHFRLTARALRQAQPDLVFHLAAAGVTDPFLSVDTAVRHNVTGTTNLIRACFEKSPTCQRLILARTPGEETQLNVYAASKAAAWQFGRMYARTQGWPIVGATVFQAYGPGQPEGSLVPAAAAAALAGRDFPMTAGEQRRDWIYIEDVVAGFIALSRAELPPGTTVDLGTGEATSVAEVVQMIYQLAGKGGRPLPGVLPSRPGEVAGQVADSTRTRQLTGWHRTIPLAAGLSRFLRDVK